MKSEMRTENNKWEGNGKPEEAWLQTPVFPERPEEACSQDEGRGSGGGHASESRVAHAAGQGTLWEAEVHLSSAREQTAAPPGSAASTVSWTWLKPIVR